MDPQRFVQRAVERGTVAPELSPELLLPPGVGKRRGIVNGPLHLGGVAAQEDEASAPCPRSPATMCPSYRLTRAPSWGSGERVGKLAH
jgi:hypothetical protein